MFKYSLIPGLESFMEDTEVNVEVAVGEPDEVAEEVVETSEAAEETGAVTEEAEATDEQTEMILAQFAELEHRYNHVKKYGVDRTFMRLFNSNGEMERAFRISLPSCESFDATGDKYSPESKAVLAGLEASLSDIWTFIKNLCAKIGRFFGRIVDFFRVRFGNLNKQIGRLKDFLKDRVDDPEAVKDADRKIAGPADLKKAGAELDKVFLVDESNGFICIKNSTIAGQLVALEADMEGLKGLKASELPSKTKDDIKKFNEEQKKAKEELNKVKKDLSEQIKADTSVSDVAFNDCHKYLEVAAICAREHERITKIGEKRKLAVKQAERTASNMSARREELAAGMSAFASAFGKAENFKLSCFNVYSNIVMKIGMTAIGGCSARARYSKKSGS